MFTGLKRILPSRNIVKNLFSSLKTGRAKTANHSGWRGQFARAIFQTGGTSGYSLYILRPAAVKNPQNHVSERFYTIPHTGNPADTRFCHQYRYVQTFNKKGASSNNAGLRYNAYKYKYGGHNAYSYEYGGHRAYEYGGHPAPAGRALPNLINAVRMLKSKPRWYGVRA
jgi:hypothetical protein